MDLVLSHKIKIMPDKRVEAILTEEQYEYLVARAKVSGISTADVIRLLITEDQRMQAVSDKPPHGTRTNQLPRMTKEVTGKMSAMLEG